MSVGQDGQRSLRRALNRVSMALTNRWSAVPRHIPEGRATERGGPVRAGVLVPSPAGWEVPPGQRPGWSWLPPQGGTPLLHQMPWWVRWWYRTPFIDRYAYQWMWWHGGWGVPAAQATGPGDGPAGVRAPRRPGPQAPVIAVDPRADPPVA